MNALLNNLRKVPGLVSNNLLINGVSVTRVQHVIIKSDLKITWVRPKKIHSTDPSKTGDGGLDLDVKGTDKPVHYCDSEELKTADETVQKLFTLDYLPSKYTVETRRVKTLEKVQAHVLDEDSMEAQIGVLTNRILYLQERLASDLKNNHTKHVLKLMIDQRISKLLKLRKQDYRKFEWILEQLNLVVKPFPDTFIRIERKDSWRKIVNMECEEIRNKKLLDYKNELRAQQKDFFNEKLEKLEFIKREEEALGLEPTITDEQIEAARKKVAEFK